MMKIFAAFFSATDTTRKIVRSIAENLGGETTYLNLTTHPLDEDVELSPEDLLIVGMPVYAGRIPQLAVGSLKHLKGQHTPAILVAVYGNRAFDDVFVEMQDIVDPNGFFVFAAAAFVAQHSIFPKTAAGRPDASDYIQAGKFCDRCKDRLYRGFPDDATSIHLPGNRPYKIPGNIPLKVKGDRRCTACGACVRACPAGAISLSNPRVTDYSRCIHCARCINICPEHSRHFSGLLYPLVARQFGKKNSLRLEPQFFF